MIKHWNVHPFCLKSILTIAFTLVFALSTRLGAMGSIQFSYNVADVTALILVLTTTGRTAVAAYNTRWWREPGWFGIRV